MVSTITPHTVSIKGKIGFSITVRRSADTRTKTRVVSTTKTGKERKIYIGPRTVEILKPHRARQLEERMKASAYTSRNGHYRRSLA
jgi:hypothetical protein